MTAAPFRPLSPRFWVARQVELLALAIVAGGIATASSARSGGAWIASACTLVALTCAWLVERGRYRSWGFAERDEDLIVTRGLLFRRVSVIPYGRMQFVDVSAGPVDRLFGLATVKMHTAAAASDARIPGLLQRDADALRDRLAAVGEAQATGL